TQRGKDAPPAARAPPDHRPRRRFRPWTNPPQTSSGPMSPHEPTWITLATIIPPRRHDGAERMPSSDKAHHRKVTASGVACAIIILGAILITARQNKNNSHAPDIPTR